MKFLMPFFLVSPILGMVTTKDLERVSQLYHELCLLTSSNPNTWVNSECELLRHQFRKSDLSMSMDTLNELEKSVRGMIVDQNTHPKKMKNKYQVYWGADKKGSWKSFTSRVFTSDFVDSAFAAGRTGILQDLYDLGRSSTISDEDKLFHFKTTEQWALMSGVPISRELDDESAS